MLAVSPLCLENLLLSEEQCVGPGGDKGEEGYEGNIEYWLKLLGEETKKGVYLVT